MASPLQPVYNIAALCAAHGLTEVVLSPGSRCAPLTLAFARHPDTNVLVVPDERAAAFIGLGIAQARRVPTVLVCTSGTAGLNYAPAVAEAYYQQVPLLILTADRPPEWIDQLDGQTIRQTGLYGPHVKASYTFPTEFSHPDAKWHSERIINEAINLAKAYPPGPVHVNIPLREPLYPKAGEEVEFGEVRDSLDGKDESTSLAKKPSDTIRLVSDLAYSKRPAEFGDTNKTFDWLLKLGRCFDRILVVVGQHHFDEEFSYAVKHPHLVVIADYIANLHTDGEQSYNLVNNHDVFLAHVNQNLLKPDALITCGLSTLSKSLKQFIRKNPPKIHLHIQEEGPAPDLFTSVTHIIRMKPEVAFLEIGNYLRDFRAGPPLPEARDEWDGYEEHDAQVQAYLEAHPRTYYQMWTDINWKAEHWRTDFFSSAKAAFNEMTASFKVLHLLEANTTLHLANSMAVRYANILGVPAGVEVFANRGTSGIDGCTSTAVGYALAQPDQQVVLLTGDVAFFYDRNAFWHNYPTPNLRVVLLNNHGGGIFRLIDGPRQQPEIDEFFETRQQLTAENLCRDFHLPYFPVTSMAELEAALPVFFGPEGAGGVLEIQTDSKVNAAFFEQYRAAVKAAFS